MHSLADKTPKVMFNSIVHLDKTVQQLRKLFNDDFGMACGEHYPLDEYDPVNRTYVTTSEGKDRALDAALDEVLMRRDAIRHQLVLSARQKKGLPREIRCLTQMSWTCSHKTGTGFYTRCGKPVNDY